MIKVKVHSTDGAKLCKESKYFGSFGMGRVEFPAADADDNHDLVFSEFFVQNTIKHQQSASIHFHIVNFTIT